LSELTLYGAAGSGSIAVEAVLTLLNIPYLLIEAVTWEDEQARERISAVNAMRQVPTLVYAGGEIMTESAGIMIDLADRHLGSMLAPPLTRFGGSFFAVDALRIVVNLFALLDQGRRDANRHPARFGAGRDRCSARSDRVLLAKHGSPAEPGPVPAGR
jgi:glutathione S-transferase